MQIHSESVIHHPIDLVFRTYRDRLPEIAEYIPDVREVQNLSREEVDGWVKLHNVWRAEREIPRLLQTVLKPEMLFWDDYAEWNEEQHVCRWTLKTRVFTEQVDCGGLNTFESVEGGRATRLVITGHLDIDLKNIPGVPRLLAPKLRPQLEKFIVGLITPNLEQVNRSLERFLDAQA